MVASLAGVSEGTVTAKPAAGSATTSTSTESKSTRTVKTVTILVVAPASGATKESGDAALRAVKLAIAHATEDRLLPSGWGVEVETIDETAKSGPAAAVGRKLKKEADIVAVIGALAPSTASPLEAMAAKQNTTLLVLSPASAPHIGGATAATSAPVSGSVTATVASSLPAPPLTLRMLTDDTTAGTYAAAYTLTSAVAAIAKPPTVTTSEAGENARAFTMAVDARLVASGASVTALGLASTDSGRLTPAFVTKVFEGAPPLVVFGGKVETGLPLSSAARARQPQATFLSGSQDGVAGCADALSALGEGDLCAVGATPLSMSLRARAFREDYAAAGYGAPTVSVTAAYDAAMLVILALRPAIGTLGAEPDPGAVRAPLMDALRTARLDGATGSTTFDGGGNRVTSVLSVLRKQGGRWVAVAATG